MVSISYPENGLPYFAALPYYLWGEVNYDSEGDCRFPTDKNWTCLEVYDRSKKDKHFSVVVNKDRTELEIDGDDESVKKIQEFFSENPDADGLKRVQVVNYCFEHPALQKFNNHSFWGSWKWVGIEATEYTYIGRWLMLDAMRGSDQGAWLAFDWFYSSVSNQQAESLLKHLKEICGENIYKDGKFTKQFIEPDPDVWEAQLLKFYKSLLEKFGCLEDPLMLREYEDEDEDSEDSRDLLANSWSLYGIDIYSKDALEKFEKMGYTVLPTDEELDSCTYKTTGAKGFIQASYRCYTCFPDDMTDSVCRFCIEDCKKNGHNISDIKYVPGFCDKQMGLE